MTGANVGILFKCGNLHRGSIPSTVKSNNLLSPTPHSLLTHLSDLVHYDDTNPTHQQNFVDGGPRFKRKQNYKSVQP